MTATRQEPQPLRPDHGGVRPSILAAGVPAIRAWAPTRSFPVNRFVHIREAKEAYPDWLPSNWWGIIGRTATLADSSREVGFGACQSVGRSVPARGRDTSGRRLRRFALGRCLPGNRQAVRSQRRPVHGLDGERRWGPRGHLRGVLHQRRPARRSRRRLGRELRGVQRERAPDRQAADLAADPQRGAVHAGREAVLPHVQRVPAQVRLPGPDGGGAGRAIGREAW